MTTSDTNKPNFVKHLIILLLALLPVSVMTGHNTPSIIFYLLIALSLYFLFTDKNLKIKDFYKKNKWLVISLLFPTVTILFVTIYHQQLPGRDLETAIRFFLGTIVLLIGLQSIKVSLVQRSLWGYIIAGIASAIFVFYLAWNIPGRPDTKAMYNAVIYGNMIFALAIITFFSIPIKITKYKNIEFIFKIIAGSIIFIAFALTQTRTTWLAIPAVIIIGAITFSKSANIKRIILLGVFFAIGFSAIYVSSDSLKNRTVLAYNQIVECHGENSLQNNSLCIRFQLWRASLDMAKERPIAGNGNTVLFTETLQKESLPKGLVTPYVSKWWEPHSDTLLWLASFGIPGGLAILLIYFAPAIVFAKRLSFKNSPSTRAAAGIGLCICIIFFISGFGDTMFRIMRIASFYAVMLALFLRLSESK